MGHKGITKGEITWSMKDKSEKEREYISMIDFDKIVKLKV